MKHIKSIKLVLSAMAVCVMTGPAMADAGHIGDEQAQVKAIMSNLLGDNADYVKTHKAYNWAPQIKGQQPRATVVTCSDSRVQTTAFDKTPEGDLFMVRDIGNQLATGEGSVEFGVRYLHTPLLIFVGHSSCGAIKAAMGNYSSIEAPIKRELDTIKIPGKNANDDQEVQANVEVNVNNQVKSAMEKFAAEIKAGKLTVVGAVYDFRNDYKQGNGSLVLVNINGETDQAKIKQSSILPHGK